MTTKAKAIDELADVLANNNVTFASQTTAGRIEELAGMIQDGTITIGGGGGGVTVIETTVTAGSGELSFTNATALCDALDAIAADPKKFASYAVAANTQPYRATYNVFDNSVVASFVNFVLMMGTVTGEEFISHTHGDSTYYSGEFSFTRADIDANDTVSLSDK